MTTKTKRSTLITFSLIFIAILPVSFLTSSLSQPEASTSTQAINQTTQLTYTITHIQDNEYYGMSRTGEEGIYFTNDLITQGQTIQIGDKIQAHFTDFDTPDEELIQVDKQ